MLQSELKNLSIAALEECALKLKNAALDAARHIQANILLDEGDIEVELSNGLNALVNGVKGTVAHLGEDCKSIPVLTEVIAELQRLLGGSPKVSVAVPLADRVVKTAIPAIADGQTHEAELS